MQELELSHKTLLMMIDQLNVKLHQIENANVRVKGKLREIQEDLINVVENQEKLEKKQKKKIHWLQDQLKTKEDEIRSQSEYFEHYKQRQRQQASVMRERECYLQGEVCRLEKQVLNLSAHTACLTSKLEEGMVQYLQQKLESAFSGTHVHEHSDVEVMELKTCIENVQQDMKSYLEAFQQNLKVLKENEEDNRREQEDLLTELQRSQDTEDFLRRKLEESCHRVYSLKLSEIKLQEKMEEILDENRVLKDQHRVKWKKTKEKDSRLTRLENGDSSVDLNGNQIQDDTPNLKGGAVLASLRSRATQTPFVLLHDKESGMPGCSCDGLKKMEGLLEELELEHNSSAFGKVAGLAEIEKITFGTKRTGALEDSLTLFRCTPNYCASRPLPPCSEKLTNEDGSNETKDEDDFSLLKEQYINLPSETFPVFVFEALMGKKLQLSLLEPESYHISVVTTAKKVRSLDFCEENTKLCSDCLCFFEEGSSDKASALLHGKMPCQYNMEKDREIKQIVPKSTSKKECLYKVVDDERCYQKVFKGRAEEEIQNEKAQPQQMTCVSGEISKVLNITELISLGKQGMEAKDSLGSPQNDQILSVDFEDLKKHFEGTPHLTEKQGKLSEIYISEVNGIYDGEIIKMEEKGEQRQKPTHQANPSTSTGLKEKKDWTLKLGEPKETFSCQNVAAENTQYAYSQNFLESEEERHLLNMLPPIQERAVSLSKTFLPGSHFYECFCHLTPLETGNECNVKIRALEEVVALCCQRIFLLMQENENYSKKVCVLQQENERYAQILCALEEEMDAYFQQILAVDEANIISFQNLLNEKEVASECYNNLSGKNTISPAMIFLESFSKNFSCLEEENRKSEKDSLTIASNKLPRSFLSLSGRKMRYFQLLSDLKEERSRCFKEIAKLLQDKENYVEKCNELIREREENLQRISLLEGEKETLSGCLAELKHEHDKYKTLVSELHEHKTSCYQTLSTLQEESCDLKREMERIKKETSQQLDEFQKANASFILENNKMKELISSLGFTYEELREDRSLETKKKTVKLKEVGQQCGLRPTKVETACSVTQTEEEGVLVMDMSNCFPGKEGSTSESYSVMEMQVEKAKEELKLLQKELEKSKKEAQKWYRELGFAETRYEETKTHLTQALSELDSLKQNSGNKMPGKKNCKSMPVYTVKDALELEDNKIANKRLQQQVLTLKAQLRDQAALQNQFHELQNEVELLRPQLFQKEKELQERKSETKLMQAPLKAKVASLIRKCQERNSFIMRMHGEFHRQGIINAAFDEEVKKLVDDIALAEYTVAFTPKCDQEPSSTDISQTSAQPKDHETYIQVSGMTGSVPASSQQEVDGIHSSHITPNMYDGSAVKLTSPERIIALHQEPRQNHHKNYQIPSVVSSNSTPMADFNLHTIHKEAPWPLLSRMKDALVPPEHRGFWATKGRDRLLKSDDVFWGQIGNQPAGAIPQGMKQKDAIMNKACLSREKTDGSTSATTAKSYLSDVLSASNKGQNLMGRNQLHGKE